MRPSRRSLWIPVLPFILAGCAAGEDADEDTSTDATDATDDGGGDALAVISLDPATGPLEGGTPVTVTGQGFVTGTTVTCGWALAQTRKTSSANP